MDRDGARGGLPVRRPDVTRRILVSYLLMSLLILVMLTVPLGRNFADRERERLLTAIERDSRVLAAEADDAFESGDFSSLPALVERYVGETGGRAVMVNASGQAVIDSDDPDGPSRDFSTRPEIAAALEGRYTTGQRVSNTLGESLVYVAVPVVQEGEVLGAVRVTYPTTAVDHRTRAVWVELASLGAVVLGVVALGGWFVAATLARPIRRLEVAADELASGELSARVTVDHGPADLVRVARSFNAMADANQGLIESQRAFLADASHQLRTPLTALRLRLEALSESGDDESGGDESGGDETGGGQAGAVRSAEDQPAVDRTVENRAEAVEAATAEVDRLSGLVDALLAMARLDAQPGRITTIDVGAVIDERVETWRPLADEQGVGLDLDGERAGVRARVVDGGLEQILDNLISNALDVSLPGASITVRVQSVGAHVLVVVADQGPGLDEAQRARAFDRFWRGPNPADGGSGLGLAIVRRLAELSGGSATMEPGTEGGLRVVVTLPVSAAN